MLYTSITLYSFNCVQSFKVYRFNSVHPKKCTELILYTFLYRFKVVHSAFCTALCTDLTLYKHCTDLKSILYRLNSVHKSVQSPDCTVLCTELSLYTTLYTQFDRVWGIEFVNVLILFIFSNSTKLENTYCNVIYMRQKIRIIVCLAI